MPPRDIANVMTEAVVEFAAQSPVYLHQISVCIFQTSMVQQFADAVANKVSNSSWQQTMKGALIACFTSFCIHPNLQLEDSTLS